MSIYIARAHAIAARVLEGEMIVMSIKDSTLFTLNEVGTEIWQAADGRTPLADIVRDKVCTQFQVQPGEALDDAGTFCKSLAAYGLLLISDSPIDRAASS